MNLRTIYSTLLVAVCADLQRSDVRSQSVTLLKSWSLHVWARIAQGIERLPPEQKAVGSIPTAGTIFDGSNISTSFLSQTALGACF